MTPEEWISEWGEEDPELVQMDGYADCLAGLVYRFGQEPILCYDWGKVIGKLVADGMTEDEAEEFFEFNQIGAWVGERTPCFIVWWKDLVDAGTN